MGPSKLAPPPIVLLLSLLTIPLLLTEQGRGLDKPPIEITSDSTLHIGKVEINTAARSLSISGEVNLTHGLMEYLAVARQGKTHESVLTLDVEPLHIQLGLLLLGLDYQSSLRFQGDSIAPAGDTVEIIVAWRDSLGEVQSVPAHRLLRNSNDSMAMSPTNWVFTGSVIWEGRLMADVEGSVIATYADPVAILNNPLQSRLDDMTLEANPEVLPPRGTPIYLKIKPASDM